MDKISRFRAPQLMFLRIAAFMGATAVLLGAFAAHGLRGRLSQEMLTVFEVGVRYHMFHALAIFAAALAPETRWEQHRLHAASWAWTFGIVVFSGSLYLLAVMEMTWMGAVTPFGGVALVVAWALVALPKQVSVKTEGNA